MTDISATSKERHAVLARFIRNQVSLSDRPPVGCIQLNNEEASLCAEALEQNQQMRQDWATICAASDAMPPSEAAAVGDAMILRGLLKRFMACRNENGTGWRMSSGALGPDSINKVYLDAKKYLAAET